MSPLEVVFWVCLGVVIYCFIAFRPRNDRSDDSMDDN